MLGRRNARTRRWPGPPTAQARGSTATPTLDGVRRKGFVQCGVTTGVAGFSTPDAQGQWRGLDVDVCRAIAAAVLGDATKVRFTPLTAAQRFTALQTGEIDVLSRITTITFQRDVQLGIEFPAINWYDGTTFIVRKASQREVGQGPRRRDDLRPAGHDERGRRRRLFPQAQAHVHAGRDRAAGGGRPTPTSPGRCDAFSQDQVDARGGARARARTRPITSCCPR